MRSWWINNCSNRWMIRVSWGKGHRIKWLWWGRPLKLSRVTWFGRVQIYWAVIYPKHKKYPLISFLKEIQTLTSHNSPQLIKEPNRAQMWLLGKRIASTAKCWWRRGAILGIREQGSKLLNRGSQAKCIFFQMTCGSNLLKSLIVRCRVRTTWVKRRELLWIPRKLTKTLRPSLARFRKWERAAIFIPVLLAVTHRSTCFRCQQMRKVIRKRGIPARRRSGRGVRRRINQAKTAEHLPRVASHWGKPMRALLRIGLRARAMNRMSSLISSQTLELPCRE